MTGYSNSSYNETRQNLRVTVIQKKILKQTKDVTDHEIVDVKSANN